MLKMSTRRSVIKPSDLLHLLLSRSYEAEINRKKEKSLYAKLTDESMKWSGKHFCLKVHQRTIFFKKLPTIKVA